MSIAELELKTENFLAGMSDEDLSKIEEILEDRLAAQLADRALRRLASGESRLVPWEEVEARLCKKFGLNLDRATP